MLEVRFEPKLGPTAVGRVIPGRNRNSELRGRHHRGFIHPPLDPTSFVGGSTANPLGELSLLVPDHSVKRRRSEA